MFEIGKKKSAPKRVQPSIRASDHKQQGKKQFSLGAVVSDVQGRVASAGKRSAKPQRGLLKKNSFQHRFMRAQFTGATRIEIYETLELMLSNRVQISVALREMYKIESKGGKKKSTAAAVVLFECMTALEDGRMLSDALANWVPDQEAQLLRAGERSGDMTGALIDAVRIIEAKAKIRGALLGGAFYPLILFSVTVALLDQIANKMVPEFEKLLKPEQWDGAALALRHIAYYVTEYGLMSFVGFILFFIWSMWSLPYLAKARIRRHLDKLPPWSLYRMLNGSTFLLNVAVMLRAGVRLQEILIIMGSSGSPWLKVRVRAALNGINQGLNLGEALHQAGYGFPDERAVQFLRILADQDGFEDKLTRFGDRWLDKSVQNMQFTSRMMMLVSVIITGSLMLLIIAGVMSIQQLALG